jgi:hypothetical protein
MAMRSRIRGRLERGWCLCLCLFVCVVCLWGLEGGLGEDWVSGIQRAPRQGVLVCQQAWCGWGAKMGGELELVEYGVSSHVVVQDSPGGADLTESWLPRLTPPVPQYARAPLCL